MKPSDKEIEAAVEAMRLADRDAEEIFADYPVSAKAALTAAAKVREDDMQNRIDKAVEYMQEIVDDSETMWVKMTAKNAIDELKTDEVSDE